MQQVTVTKQALILNSFEPQLIHSLKRRATTAIGSRKHKHSNR